uniref:Zinc finger protein 786 n=1 Tax=Spermophilus dauricus TaxID=99837 RepID=A0A8C9PYT6_SPEDA
MYFDPHIEGEFFGGSQETVKSGETKCHFQFSPLQSQYSHGRSLGERKDVSFLPDHSITLMNPKTHNTQALATVVHSSSKSAYREEIPSHRAVGHPGLKEGPSWQSTQHSCPVCGEGFWKKNHLVKHQRSHSKDASCGAWKKFNQQADAQEQWDISRTQRHFRCPECGKSFHLKQYLLRHMAVHTKKSPFQCPECKMCFCQEQTLLSHHLGHKGEKPSQYHRCNKSGFSTDSAQAPQCQHRGERPASWRSGIGGHSGQEPGLGLDCEEGQLLRHQRLHTDEKAHQLRHGGERPFACSECGRGFTHQCKLREHLRVHSGERPFQCPECSKSFRLKGILKAHQRTHSKERPFSCAECGKGFTRQGVGWGGKSLTKLLRLASNLQSCLSLPCHYDYRHALQCPADYPTFEEINFT